MRIQITPHAQTSSESIANPAEKPADPFSALLASLRAPAPAEGAPTTMKSREEQPTMLPADLNKSSSNPALPTIATSVATASEGTMPDALTIRAPRAPAKSPSDVLAGGKKRRQVDASEEATREAPTVALPPALKAPVMPLTLSLTANVKPPAQAPLAQQATHGEPTTLAQSAEELDPSDAPTSRPQKRRGTKELATAALQEATRDALRKLKQAPTQIAPMNVAQNASATPNAAQTLMQFAQAFAPQGLADHVAPIVARGPAAVRANAVTYAESVVLIRDAQTDAPADARGASNSNGDDEASAAETSHDASRANASHDATSADATDDASDEHAYPLFAITRDTLRSNTSEEVTMPAPPLLPPMPAPVLSTSPSATRSSSPSLDDDSTRHSSRATSTSPTTPVVAHAPMPALSIELDVAPNKTPEKPADHVRFTDALISNVERAVTDKRETSSFEVRAFDGTKVAVNVEMEGENVRVAFSFDAKHSAAETAVRASVGTLETKLGEHGLSTVVSIAAFSDKRAASLAQVGEANGGSAASGFGSDTDDRNGSRGASYEALADLASSSRVRAARNDDTTARDDRGDASTSARRGWVA